MTARGRYEIRYSFGQLIYNCDVLDRKYRETKSVSLNWKERKEFKSILKQYKVLDWNELEEYFSLDSDIKLYGIKSDKFYSCHGNLRTKSFYFKKDTIPLNFIEFRKRMWTFVLKAIGKPDFSEEDAHIGKVFDKKAIRSF